MPVYDYRCTECGKSYDVYHKVKEVVADIVCPACGSPNHKKLFSTAAVAVSGSTHASSSESSCEMGGACCGGACGLN